MRCRTGSMARPARGNSVSYVIVTHFLRCNTVYAQIFVVSIFRDLIIRGFTFSWLKPPTKI